MDDFFSPITSTAFAVNQGFDTVSGQYNLVGSQPVQLQANMLDFSDASTIQLVGGLGQEANWGIPGEYIPSTTLSNTGYSYGTGPSYTQQSIGFSDFHSDAAGNSDFGAAAAQTTQLGVIPETVIPMVEPTFGNFVDWIFNGGN